MTPSLLHTSYTTICTVIDIYTGLQGRTVGCKEKDNNYVVLCTET